MGIFSNIGQIDCSTITCAGALGAMTTQDQQCPENITQAEVNTLIFWHPTLGTDITNWPVGGSAGLVAGDFAIDNTDATDVNQKQLFGVGSIAEPEESEATINDFQSIVLNRRYTLTFTTYDLGDDTYDYLRKVQCGKVRPKFVFGDVGGYLYGIDGGIVPAKWTVAFPHNTGQDALNQAIITILFDADTDPDRVVNPL